MNQTGCRLEAAGEVCLALAELFHFPAEATVSQIRSGQFDKDLAELFQQAQYLLLPPDFRSLAKEWAALQADYARCFWGGGLAPTAIPVESVYKIWTTDPTAQVMIASSKGYLMGDSAIHILYILEQLNMTLPEEYRQMPDHLAILLELLACIIRTRPVGEKLSFIRDHFDWLDDLLAALASVPGHEFFSYTVRVIRSVVAAEAVHTAHTPC